LSSSRGGESLLPAPKAWTYEGRRRRVAKVSRKGVQEVAMIWLGIEKR